MTERILADRPLRKRLLRSAHAWHLSELDAAYALCRRLNAHHGKTYYFSTLFFPPAVRRSVHALYGFVRYPDEIVDNPPPGSDPAQALADYREATLDALKTGSSDLPVLHAFADMARRHRLPPEYPLAFLDAMAMDLTRTRYETFADLQTYTYGSASVVGLMMCCVVGVSDAGALRRAHDLGLAMQLTNFWRDIGEDWATRGRIYLPQEDLRALRLHRGDAGRGRRQRPVHRPDAVRDRPRPRVLRLRRRGHPLHHPGVPPARAAGPHPLRPDTGQDRSRTATTCSAAAPAPRAWKKPPRWCASASRRRDSFAGTHPSRPRP